MKIDIEMIRILHYAIRMPYELFFTKQLALMLNIPIHTVRRSLRKLCKIGFMNEIESTNPRHYRLLPHPKKRIKSLKWTFLGAKDWR
jgi:predicted transcriptional regulator